MNKLNYSFLLIVVLSLLWACAKDETSNKSDSTTSTTSTSNAPKAYKDYPIQFQELQSDATGIKFTNTVKEEPGFDYWTFPHFYNGGGVSVGDINGDELADIFFTGNQVGNALYLNKGDLTFEDITARAKIVPDNAWNTSTTMADINGDGLLDIYVCRSGFRADILRQNQLYINNGDLTFTESAANYGLGDRGYSAGAVFFDYDKDGLLDMYLINHPIDYQSNSTIRPFEGGNFKAHERDKLYKQVAAGKFEDVSLAAGINNLAWGLSVSVGDLNDDGWLDIYVANDFLEPDFMYYNNQDGTFTNQVLNATKHISFNGMGSDIADINNDALPDIMVVDMLPSTNKISKTMMASMRPAFFRGMVQQGNHYQYMCNTLQLNQGDGQFSEIGQFAGINKTDWSWAILAADYNNDGFKDLFVTNGIKRDITDNDLKNRIKASYTAGNRLSPLEAAKLAPARKINNVFFQNTGNLQFKELTYQAGLKTPVNSNGAAYADLDKDGDLDLVINSIDAAATIYKNTSAANNYLRVRLEGKTSNRLGIGAKVTLLVDGQKMMQEQILTRGFQSSVEPILHFGLGENKNIAQLQVTWPDGKTQVLKEVAANQVLSLKYAEAKAGTSTNMAKTTPIFKEIQNTPLQFAHQENPFDDFSREILLPHKQSQLGPFMAVGDVNGDQLQDVYIGGAYGTAGALYVQAANQNFVPTNVNVWQESANFEDMGCLFFDADGDGDQDLYVVSGGNETSDTRFTQDRIYLNDGKGNFSFAANRVANVTASGSCVVATDFDKDGDLDLFVGGRAKPALYPMADRSYLLENNNGVFQDVTATLAPDLANIGIVTDAMWTDIDADGTDELMLVGEWTAIHCYKNEGGKFKDISAQYGLEEYKGWWNSITANDIDGDGDLDYIVGNIGMNNKFQPNMDKPLHLYAHDFDGSGSLDIVLAKYAENELVPLRGRECSSEQMPFILDKFPTYDAFGEATIQDVYGEKLQEAKHLTANYFYSAILINKGGKFDVQALNPEAQLAPVNAALVDDYNKDGIKDLLLAGNRFGAEPETVRYDAGNGTLLLGTGNADAPFRAVPNRESGFVAPQNAKSLARLNAGGKSLILVGNNAGKLQCFEF